MKDRKSAFACLATALLFVLTGCGGNSSNTSPSPAVHNEWAWMNGSNTVEQPGIYGKQGTAATSNVPGARVFPSSSTDPSGNFWLFGGYGTGATTASAGDHNDLWKYSNGEWTWVSGSTDIEQTGIYGTRGIASPGNVPGARLYGVNWIDLNGSFWLFGGVGIDSAGTRGELNDLWKYSDGEWTWMSGSNVASQSGIAGAYQGTGLYGVRGLPDPGNNPGTRFSASSWTDPAGNLWLFGGLGVDSTSKLGVLNDLWRYSGGQWTWMAGSNLGNPYGTYGTQGTPAPANTPGARGGAITWVDASGNLWLFGGQGNDVDGTRCLQTGSPCDLSDLWKFSGGEWTWVGGPNQANEPAVFGTQGVASPANIPTPRDSAVGWTDAAGNFWLFGGEFMTATQSDLWKYSGGQWTWVNGPQAGEQLGVYGTLGVPSASNVPNARYGAAGWIDGSGHLWLFGGMGPAPWGVSILHQYFNDLWEYQP